MQIEISAAEQKNKAIEALDHIRKSYPDKKNSHDRAIVRCAKKMEEEILALPDGEENSLDFKLFCEKLGKNPNFQIASMIWKTIMHALGMQTHPELA